MIKKLLIFTIIIFGIHSPVYAITYKYHVTGVKEELLKNIESHLAIMVQDLPPDANPQDLDELLDLSVVEIKNALAPYGFFKPEIKAAVNRKKDEWNVTYHIQPGPLLYITALDLKIKGEGANDKAFQKLLANLALREGDVLRSKLYQDAKSDLVNLAAQKGYFAAKIEKSSIVVDLNTYQATVKLHFNTGPRYYFGDVEFSPSPYSEKFLRRFIPFTAYQPYSNNKVVTLQENLANTNFFQQVSVTPKPEWAQNLVVPIEVTVIPRKALQYSIGAGFGTDTGIRGLLGLQLRRLTSTGHHLEAMLQASEKQNHFEASYSIPGRNPVTDLYKLTAAVEEQHLIASGKTQNAKIQASHISTIFGWQQTLALDLRTEHSIPTDGPIVNSTMLLPNANWLKVKSDNLLNPSRGYSLNLNIRGASKALLSNTDFIQAQIQGKTILPLSNAARLILRGQLGYTIISDVDELPLTLQFYSGGSQTVRGYQYQELGPGRTLLVGSIELQQRIKGDIYGAVFMDAGNVSNGLTNNLKKSIGIGLVWRSPVGSIAVTLAQALDKPGQPRLLQFSMGPEF